MNSLFSALVFVLVGAWVIRFARSAYRQPDVYLARWFRGYIIPPFRWNSSRLRGFAIVWIFGGVLFITTAVSLVIPFLPRRLPLLSGICIAATVLLIPRQ